MLTGRSAEDLAQELLQLTRKQQKALFVSLPAPEVAELDGEFEGLLLNQGNFLITAITRFILNKRGRWIGKGFQPLSENHGLGYNIFRTRRGYVRCYRMHVRLYQHASVNRLAVEYDGLNDGVVGNIFDDIRRVAPGLFLGIGYASIGGRRIPQFRRKIYFALKGPIAGFQVEAAREDTFTAHEH